MLTNATNLLGLPTTEQQQAVTQDSNCIIEHNIDMDIDRG